METIIEQERKKRSFISQTNVVAKEEQQLADFMKGTISGDELVKYVCDRLDEKYNQSQ
jgi:hypothetical protein